MKISGRITIALFVLVLIALGCNTDTTKRSSKEESTRPNILLVLCDDLGYADVGFNGGKDTKTPALDALAQNGTIFSSAYVVHPFCGPSRAGLMTGRYPHEIGSQFNLPRNSQYSVKDGIPLSETFISKVLQNSGYATGIVGKWHLGAVDGFRPNDRGFDDFFGFEGGGHHYFPAKFSAQYNKMLEDGEKEIWDYLMPLEHNGVAVDETEYITDAFSREACRFITDASQKEDPFFLYLAYNAPHSPLQAKEEDMALFNDVQDKDRRTYLAMVHAVDRGMEQVVKKLKETGQYENTLIVFFSDNGGKLKYGASNLPLTGEKGDANEGGYRVPMFFHWPSKVPAGQTYKHAVSSVDFYPTFAGLAGATIPEAKTLDGKDIWSDFLAGTAPHKGEMLYCLRHRTGYSDVGARRDHWKVLKVGEDSWKLFNIDEDISEKKDLSAQYPEVLKEMVANVEKWSHKHVQPRWFHDEQTGKEWREAKMPRFDQTFIIK